MATTTAVNLPEDVLTAILLRLPVKSLVRFTSVSKSWFALIRSPRFLDMHLKFSLARDEQHVLIKRFLEDEHKPVLSIHSNDEYLRVVAPNLEVQGLRLSAPCVRFVGCCNGIVCISMIYVFGRNDFLLCNPAMREFRIVPPSPFECPDDTICFTEGVGFGFDPVSNEYKVVRITWTDSDDYGSPNEAPRRAEIYDLRKDTWRELDAVVPRVLPRDRGFNLLCKGSIHWHAWEGDWQPFILSLNISSEEFKKYEFPDSYGQNHKFVHFQPSLAVIHETLAVIFYTSRYPQPHPCELFIDIWVMNEYGVDESWSKQYSVGPLVGIDYPISVWKNRILLLSSCLQDDRDGCDRQLVSCDLLNHGQPHKYDVYSSGRSIDVVFYRETLASMNSKYESRRQI